MAASVPPFSWHNDSMISSILSALQIQTGSQAHEKAREIFLWVQLGLGALLFFMVWRYSQKKSESGFGLREADRLKRQKRRNKLNSSDSLAQAKLTPRDRDQVLLLEGIRTDLPPHRLLGVSEKASMDEIQRAYRQLMKRYHPDRVGPPGSREWNDAQKIAQALNRAKDTLIQERKSKIPT